MFDELMQKLPAYVRYRNEVRGHAALSGKPSTTRLQEQTWYALSTVLDRLESFARHSLGMTSFELNGCIRVLGRNAAECGTCIQAQSSISPLSDGTWKA